MSEKRIPQKGDIVRTPRGNFASVNWVSEGEVGATYSPIAPYTGLESMVFKIEEVEVVQSGIKSFFQEMFKKMTDEELRNELKREREVRTTPPSPKQTAVRRDANMISILKELSPEELAELREWKKGKMEKEGEK